MNQPTFCAQCFQRVYAAEEVQRFGLHFHRRCFRCSNQSCGRPLDSRNSCEHSKKPYCVNCYGSKFGVHGVRGSTANSMPATVVPLAAYGDNSKSVFTNSISYGPQRAAIQKVQIRPVEARKEEKEVINDLQLFYKPSQKVNTEANIEPPKCSPPEIPQELSNIARSLKNFEINRSEAVICNRCHRCYDTVYFAEKVVVGGLMWHKRCFRCSLCEKGLDQGSVCETKGAVFCKGCYAKQNGPKGYGRIAVAGP
ncbi:unnamed protein product [Caenorhabditis auriculariae]|uniref:LIM zinc-binding domain-containing protein n=1 Tax=Caenorhabditis auriculariae TaxID=2777116 RepID=A0A8S1GQ90_9PELO|nr:unnamed protein product [Caenorhabditis auriculariae]